MASENPERPRRLKPARIILVALALIALLLVGLLAWLLGTEAGARALLPALLDRAGVAATAEGISGRLVGPLRIERLAIETDGQRIELDDVRLAWEPLALIGERVLHVESLSARHMTLIAKMDAPEEDPSLPDDLSLPVGLKIDSLRLEGGTIRRGPVPLATLGELVLGLTYGDGRYALDLRRFGARPELETGSARALVRGKLALAAQKPYPLEGRFTIDGNARVEERALGAEGKLELDGSLAELHADLALTVNGEAVTGQATLKPFTETPLAGAELHARALDLAALDASLPQTRLAVDLSAGEDGRGVLQVRNAAPGTLSEKGVPLQALEVAFNQHADGVDFPRIEAVLGSGEQPAGTLSGSGSFIGGALQLALQTDSLNLQRIDPQLRQTSLDGTIELQHSEGRQTFDVALTEPFGKQRIALNAEGTLADNVIEIKQAELQAGQGTLRASGRLELAGEQAFRAAGEVTRFDLHDFGRFEQVPAMNLNGNFALEGTRSPGLQADLRFAIEDSRLAGQPLHGKGEAQLRGDSLQVPALTLVSGANRLSAEGQLAEQGSELKFSIDAPKLGQLGGPFGGALFAEGTARGTLEEPTLDVEWRADQARLPGEVRIDSMQGNADVRIDRKAPFMLGDAEGSVTATGLRSGDQRLDKLKASLRFAPNPDAPLALDLDASGVKTAGTEFERLRVNGEGTTARHTLNLNMVEKGQTWSARARGGLESIETARWEGQLESFTAKGRLNAGMRGSAPLLLSGERTRVEDLQLDIEGGRLVLERFERGPDGIATSGRIDQLRIDRFVDLAAAGNQIKTDLELSGAWDLRYDDTLDGTLTLRRESGDVTIVGAEPVRLGLQTLRADLQANDGQLALDALVQGERAGRIAIDAATRLGEDGNPLALASDAPLSGRVDVDMPEIGWVGPVLNPALITGGRVQGEVDLGGTIGDPALAGRITGEQLRLAEAELGLDLRQGTLRGQFKGDQLVLQDLSFAGTQGKIALSGPIDLGGAPSADLRLRADQFAVLDRPDRRLTVSGESRIDWRDDRGMVIGDFLVNSGYFDIGTGQRPTLGSDVVIVGQEERQATGMPLAMDVTVRLGDGVQVEGRGLDAVVGGQVRMLSDVGEPLEVEGTLNVLDGTFSAYGRELAIERGTLRFTGPLSNPALDIVAMRRGHEVEAGVAVRGNVLSPRVTLVSEPNVPDADKLSWLVLGRSLSNAGPNEIGSLQDAAASLLTQSAAAGVQSRIANALGLDTFAIGKTDDTLEERIVTLGKQISSRLYIGYERSLESATNVVQLRYALTPQLSVEAEAGARSALSLFYNITFD